MKIVLEYDPNTKLLTTPDNSWNLGAWESFEKYELKSEGSAKNSNVTIAQMLAAGTTAEDLVKLRNVGLI